MRPRYLELLTALSAHRVSFIVVGGVAAILEGAPVTTLDLDILLDAAPANLARLQACLEEVDAHYRDPAGRDLRPTSERLETLRLHRLLTAFGPLDVLTEVGSGSRYEDLLRRTHLRSVGSLQVRVLDLEALIETKKQAGRDKDRAVLPILVRTLEATKRSR